MDTFGRHLLAEYYDCDLETLNNLERIEALFNKAATAANTTIVKSVFHRFAPQGVSGVVVIEESHLSIHTWPEHGYAAVDFYTCGDGTPELAHEVIKEGLSAKRVEMMIINRGIYPPRQSLTMVRHHSEGLEPVVRAVGSKS